MDHCAHVAVYYLIKFVKDDVDDDGAMWACYYHLSRVNWKNFIPYHGTMNDRSPKPIICP